jgi:hypothetical protein
MTASRNADKIISFALTVLTLCGLHYLSFFSKLHELPRSLFDRLDTAAITRLSRAYNIQLMLLQNQQDLICFMFEIGEHNVFSLKFSFFKSTFYHHLCIQKW